MADLRDPSTEPVSVTFEDVNIWFADNHVIKDVSLRIEPGELLTFLGPSGSGKSTLLRAVAGFGPRPAGRILIGGQDVTHLQPWRRNVGMVFQSYALWPHMTVRKNIAFGLEERKLPRRQIDERVDAALELVGLAEFANRRPSQLSGGQQQRVALARTIIVQPRVLLLDEPLSNLDAHLRIQMRREIKALQRTLNLTTIFVTHDQEEANTISDRIAVLDDGVIQQVGGPAELYDRPANRFVAGFLGTANLIDGSVRKDGGKTLFRSAGGITVPLSGDVPGDGPCTILFRPQSLEIRGAGEASPDGRIRLDGVVESEEFLGSRVRYTVKAGDATILVDTNHQAGQSKHDIGAKVALYLAADQLRVLIPKR
ncbi:MAG: ABC transporter ATP-binding protein [Proteobacteria bacterium]|nr:ABC transporter ATP-binding protein [Pseudomonadota bacterium]